MTNYGDKFIFSINVPLIFPDFTIEYLGERKVDVPQYVNKFFTYKDYKVTNGGVEKLLSWTNGTGELSPLEFEFNGNKYSFQPWGINFGDPSIIISKI